MGLRGIYIKSDLTKPMEFYPSNGYIKKDVRQLKEIYGIQVIVGLKGYLSKDIYIEPILGLGTSYRYIHNEVDASLGQPLYDQNLRGNISNMEYNNWFTPFPYLQFHIGYTW